MKVTHFLFCWTAFVCVVLSFLAIISCFFIRCIRRAGKPLLCAIYLEYLEETYIKHCLENKEITYYKRYVDDILIVFDRNKISEHTIHSFMNNLDEHLEFKMSIEENRITNYLDLSINSLQLLHQQNDNNAHL